MKHIDENTEIFNNSFNQILTFDHNEEDKDHNDIDFR